MRAPAVPPQQSSSLPALNLIAGETDRQWEGKELGNSAPLLPYHSLDAQRRRKVEHASWTS